MKSLLIVVIIFISIKVYSKTLNNNNNNTLSNLYNVNYTNNNNQVVSLSYINILKNTVILLIKIKHENNINALNEEVKIFEKHLNSSNIDKLKFLILTLNSLSKEISNKSKINSNLNNAIDSPSSFKLNTNEFKKWQMDYNKKVYEWQDISGIIIFVVIILIIFLGIIFASLQFKKKLDSRDENESSTSIKISKDGIEINSSVIGVIILLISAIFLYSYLKEIYPIISTPVDKKAISLLNNEQGKQ